MSNKCDEILIKLVGYYIPYDGVYSNDDIANAKQSLLQLLLEELDKVGDREEFIVRLKEIFK